jgi:hypothetical protein
MPTTEKELVVTLAEVLLNDLKAANDHTDLRRAILAFLGGIGYKKLDFSPRSPSKLHYVGFKANDTTGPQTMKDLVANAMELILQITAEGGLTFPLKVTATCVGGFLFGASIAFSGADPTFSSAEGIAQVTWPLTITCIGENGKKMSATFEQPEPASEGTV